MDGFVEVEDFVFGEKSQVIVDPGAESVRSDVCGGERTYIPMHHILRIDEVEKEGTGKIREASPDDKVAMFPLGGRAPKPDSSPEQED